VFVCEDEDVVCVKGFDVVGVLVGVPVVIDSSVVGVLVTDDDVEVLDGLGVHLSQYTSTRARKLWTYVTLSVGSVNVTLRERIK
jgi:hypothetical protein